uniref:Gypsy retrotransposon integrase-like protein 1 n=1 Tax=Leptobrachium leishanense TaxID=445787 RepID=A0A8C5PP86_9ANUR
GKERVEREKERVEREKVRDHELRLAEVQGQRDSSPRSDRSTGRKVPFQAFKEFRETEDEIESYLQDFERLCQVHEVHRADWVRILACKLTGRAAEAYRTVPDEEATNYTHVKQALLSRFAVTPEASRAKFRNSRRPNGATHVEWAHRLQRDLRTWFLGSKAETVPDITQLLLLEQFFEHTPSAIREWVLDKKPQTVQQEAVWADEYADTRKVTGGERSPPFRPALPAPPPPTPAVRTPAARPTSRPNNLANVRCYGCNQDGHYKQNCPNRPDLTRPPARPSPSAHCYDTETPWPEVPEEWERLHEADPVQAASADNRHHHRQAVWINGRAAEGLRDSGATITLVRPHLVQQNDRLHNTIAVRVAGGKVLRLETARVHLDWGSGEKVVRVGLLNQLPAEVLLGNDLGRLVSSYSTDAAAPVTTRQQSQRHDRGTPIGTQVRSQPKPPRPPTPRRIPTPPFPPDPPSPWSSPETLRHQTQTDPTLQCYRDRAGQGLDDKRKDSIEWEDGLLYRYTAREGSKKKQVPQKQMVVPQGPRQELLRLAHDIPLAGHLGQKKTRHRLARAFFWPRLSEDTREYCRTCPVCQKTGKAGDHPKAPLHPMPIIQEPFSRVAVDIIGPLPRPSATGKRYILTVVDYATRYPEAVALANIQADTVADALLRVLTRVGFPREILSDQGTQFTAELTQQLWRLCGVKALHSAPYHPQTNGLCERFNGTLKQLIRAFTHESKDWEKYLPHLLFAYREVPQESTGYSPFELLYGRQVRGPLDLVRAQWEGEQEEDGVPVLSYVLKLRERL